jgi:hypothetical protein
MIQAVDRLMSLIPGASLPSRPLHRRSLLTIGGLAGLGLTLPQFLRAAHAAHSTRGFGRARRCILLFLTGGPPQHDTWDPKPEAPDNVRGETTVIDTAVPGIRFGQLFPLLARCADRLCLLRSVSHTDTVHTSAGYTMLTGVPHPAPNNPMGAKTVGPAPEDHPHVGSILASVRQSPPGVPVFVSLPEVIKDAAINEFPGQNAGFMGRRFDPLRIDRDSETNSLKLPDIVLPSDVNGSRHAARCALLSQLDRPLSDWERTAAARQLTVYQQSAFALLSSRAVHDALDVAAEPPAVHAAYGPHLFGQGCLLARRLVEAGVALVTVYWHYEGPDDSPVWDTHWNNFPHLRNRLAPPCDQAVSALVDDLHQRGLMDDTLLVCLGEFGRTPRINDMGGRDHWPHVQTVLLAGAGVPAGTVYGASDREGAYPVDAPVSPADLAATLLHLLGVPEDLELTGFGGRPLRACTGSPIPAVIG